MSILSCLESPALAGALVTLVMQSLLISLLETIVLLFLKRTSAPVRSLICLGSIAALFVECRA
jgi:hypothetical protein